MKLFVPLLAAVAFSLLNLQQIMSAHAQTPFKIDADFPGGNIKVVKIEGDTVHLLPDLRTTTTDWFYWYFRVSDAGGKTLNFVFNKKHMGARGPGMSTDGGKTWKWLGADAVTDGTFSYAFPAGANDVRFSVGMPYTRSNLDEFLAKNKSNPFLKIETLTKTPKGRDVIAVRTETPGKKAPYAIVVTGRNHACEMMGSYILEGLLAGVIADDAVGKSLREQADFLFIPFMDTDGVEDGDQGKNRAPHDHNRDFGDAPLYEEVKALKKRLPEWAAGRPMVFLDLHDPALKGDYHETIHFMEPSDRDQAARMQRLSDILERDQQGPIIYSSRTIMRSGKGYNSTKDKSTHASGWGRTLPNNFLGFTIETPYANASYFEVNAHTAREFGRDIATAFKNYLREKPETIKAPQQTAATTP